MTKLPKPEKFDRNNFLSTGLTTLNLAMTGHPNCGLPLGKYIRFVGDSSTGKTWLGMQILAEAARDERLKDYQLVADMPEDGALMDVERYFGKALVDRITGPKGPVEDRESHSESVEQFYDNANAVLDKGPAIILLDSMDAIQTETENTEDEEARKARKAGKEVKGSYGTTKPKENSRKLRTLCNRLSKTKSSLVIVGQTRQNIGFGAMFNPKTTSGGDALRFYNRFEMWLSVLDRDFEKIGNKKVKRGQTTKGKVTKNHICGWEGEIDIPIYKGIGVDDTRACIRYLVDFGHWTETAKRIKASEFDMTMKLEDLCKALENEVGAIKKLRKLVAEVWKQVEEKTSQQRKSRYA